jgi:multiple sugar transport system permease protein
MKQRAFPYVLISPALLFVTLFAFYPIAYTWWLSLHRIILALPQLGEPFIGLENFRRLLHDGRAWQALGFTLLFVGVTTLLELFFGLISALALHQPLLGRGTIRAVILIPWAIPTVVSSQMWRFLFNDQYGFINLLFFGYHPELYRAFLAEPISAMVAVMAVDVWKTTPFCTLILLAGLQYIPEELYEAARVDGAGRWSQFLHITLPLLKPTMVLVLLFRTLDAFRVFDSIYVMTQGGPADATLVLQFYGYKRMFAEGLLGYGAAISVVIFIISLGVSMFYLNAMRKTIRR